MDGVPELTQPLVPPDGTFEYDFRVPDAGTYWYHPHNRTWEQLARGLYGALVVEEKEPPVVDRDEVLLIDDWRLGNDAKLEESFRRDDGLVPRRPARELDYRERPGRFSANRTAP